MLCVKGVADDFPAVFIRAPYIIRVGNGVTVLAKHEDAVVMARQGNVLVASFHPELTSDMRIHRYFVEMAKEYEEKEAVL
jgi:5'-phosphate synthase pdxT subunit